MTEPNSNTPPYVAYATFKTFVAGLAESGVVPTKIDRGVLSAFSGSVQAVLVPALKFLGLIDDDLATTASLKKLVDARREGNDQWKKQLADVVSDAYAPIVEGVDLDSGTAGELNAAFKSKASGAPSVLGKNIRFYLQALDDSGLTYSPHFKTKKRASSAPAKRRQAKPKRKPPHKNKPLGEGGEGGAGAQAPPPAGRLPESFARQDIPTITGAYIVYPMEMSEEDFKLFEAALQFVKAVTQKGGQT